MAKQKNVDNKKKHTKLLNQKKKRNSNAKESNAAKLKAMNKKINALKQSTDDNGE